MARKVIFREMVIVWRPNPGLLVDADRDQSVKVIVLTGAQNRKEEIRI